MQSLSHSARQLNRREALRIGALGTGGLTLASLLRATAFANDADKPTREPNVIILWMRGGPSHIDMWDMKPDAPVEIRGEFQPMATNVPGIQLCELLPQTAAIMDKWSIVRSLTFRKDDGGLGLGHSSGDQVCFTGYPPGRSADVNVYPSVGSVVARDSVRRGPCDLPPYVMIPRNLPGSDRGYLGPEAAPFETNADPASSSPFRVPNLGIDGDLSVERISSRQNLLKGIDSLRREADNSKQMEAMDSFSRQAWDLVTGTKAREAFDLDSEPANIRERYGFFDSFVSNAPGGGGDAPNWPQRMLLARRLVEAGVRLVTVDCRWWDTHADNFNSLRKCFLPRWDQAYSALITDLHERGLLENTLVVAWGEMGRTPKVNKNAGRDHWSGAMSAAIAGGGTVGGRVIGSTDKYASLPKDNPKIAQDVLATIYRHLGIDWSEQTVDLAGRPHPLLPVGQPITELF